MVMTLEWLQLKNFRNYQELSLEFSPHVTALVGLNAQGKTNLLESIAFLALGKSFRAHRALDTLHWEQPHGCIRAGVQRKGKITELEVFMQRSPETKKVKKASQWTTPKKFLGALKVVLFMPDHLDLILGSPHARRQYLDRLLIQLSPDYLESLSTYQKILNHRNALLKSIAHGRSQEWELDLWDTRLLEEALKIWGTREHFLRFLSERLEASYQSISATQQILRMQVQTHEQRFEERLLAHRNNDVQCGSSSVGPHRDDFILTVDGKPLAEVGSRGECRSAVLVLKMIELQYIEAQTGEKPLLLLDDVFSELDGLRQEKLGFLVQDYQSIVTTTSMEHLSKLGNAKIVTIKAGEIVHGTGVIPHCRD